MAVGDILSVEIDSSGWSANIIIEGLSVGGTYDFGINSSNNINNSKIIFDVSSESFDSSGNAIALQRSVYGTIPLRQPYPNQETNDETGNGNGTITVRVVLSSYIHTGCTVNGVTISESFYSDGSNNTSLYDGIVTNNSAAGYVKPCGNWLMVPRQQSTGNTFTASAIGKHRSSESGNLIATCKIIASDGSVTENYWANAVNVTSELTGITRTEYQAEIDMTLFLDGVHVNLDFEMYPNIGDATAVLSTSGNGYDEDDWQLSTIPVFNDRTQSYHMPYCYVDPTNGDNSAGFASEDDAIARSNPVQSIAYAIREIRDIKNTNSWAGLTNGVVRLEAGEYLSAGPDIFTPIGGELTWLVIEPAPNISREQVVIKTNPSTSERDFNAPWVKFSGITFNRDENRDMYRTAGRAWLHNCNITSLSAHTAQWSVNDVSRFITCCEVTDFSSALGANLQLDCKYNNCSSSGFLRTNVGVLYTSGTAGFLKESTGAGVSSEGGLIAYNKLLKMSSSGIAIIDLATVQNHTDNGVAIFENLIEALSLGGVYAVGISPDGSTTNTRGVIIHNNTIIGQRCNLAYNDVNGSGKTPHELWSVKNNVLEYYANKGDIFAADGNCTGNWPVAFGADNSGNCMHRGAFDQDFIGINSIEGSNETPLEIQFVEDLSGAGAGNGDYHLTADSPAVGIVFDFTSPYDIDGEGRIAGGSSGAYEFLVFIPSSRRKFTSLKSLNNLTFRR